jgi:hypothetical protein
MTKRKQVYSGPAGGYLVLGELLRRGHESYLAHGETQKGWDIVMLPNGAEPIRIQVKAIDWPNELAVNGSFDSGFDILVVVLLNKNGKPKYLLFPQADLDTIISPHNPKRQNKKRTLTVSKNYEADTVKNLSRYEDNWAIFENTNA